MDDDGLAALTMPRLARRLNVGTMSLYRHVQSKADLVEAVTERMFEDLEVPAGEPGDWEGRVVGYLRRWRQLALTHPALADILSSRPTGTRRFYEHLETNIAILEEAGFSDRDAVRAFYSLFAYVFGFVLWELPRAQALSPEIYMEESRENIEDLPIEEFPTISDLPDLLATNATPEQFEYGLERLIESLEPRRS